MRRAFARSSQCCGLTNATSPGVVARRSTRHPARPLAVPLSSETRASSPRCAIGAPTLLSLRLRNFATSATPCKVPGKCKGGRPTANDADERFARRRNQESAIPAYNFQLPTPTSLQTARTELERAVKSALEEGKLAERIGTWGIGGSELAALQRAIITAHDAGTHAEYDDVVRIKALMRLWSKTALEELRTAKSGEASSSATVWDLENIRQGLEAEGPASLNRAIVTSFMDWLEAAANKEGNLPYLHSQLARLRKAGDMRFPSLDHAAARTYTRTIHLHVGPTNSGKTHGALVALCKARTGVYAGPLRLLAHEIWDRINNGLVAPDVGPRLCNLVTGEEVKVMGDHVGLKACTVEMTALDQTLDVAVIDEIQMLGDVQRGWSWTTAVLGVAAKEVHLCGEASVIPLIKKMAEACGDIVHVHEYKRLTPLEISDNLKGQISQVRKGDCIVAFKRSDIFSLKEQVEEQTGLKCALAYGALPPETKAEQAKLFNDPDNDIDVMIASDAIGMGLNLKIKRVIFQAVTKWNGHENIVISSSQLKQIAGRAGRFGTNKKGDEAGGSATTLSAKDIGVLEEALQAPIVPISRAAVQPSSAMMTSLSILLPPLTIPPRSGEETPRQRQRSLASLYADAALLMRIDSSLYFATTMEQQTQLAPLIEEALPPSVKLTISDRERLSNAPANTRDDLIKALFSNMVRWYVRGSLVSFRDVERGLGMLDALKTVEDVTGCNKSARQEDGRPAKKGGSLDVNMLMTLESLHRGLTLYMWLSNRFRLAFCYVEEVTTYKERTERAIEACLAAIREGRRFRLTQLGRSTDSTREKRYSAAGSSARSEPSHFPSRRGEGGDGRIRRGKSRFERAPQQEDGTRSEARFNP